MKLDININVNGDKSFEEKPGDLEIMRMKSHDRTYLSQHCNIVYLTKTGKHTGDRTKPIRVMHVPFFCQIRLIWP